MKAQRVAAVCVALMLAGAAASAVQAKGPPATWDDLVLVQSKKLQRVYLRPGADFHKYHKVMLDPTEVVFEKNWVRDYNRTAVGTQKRLTDKRAEEIKQEVSAG